jgi:hypothetical protein
MSVSSNGSQLSINYNGQEMDLEGMLDETVRGIQKYLNDLQMTLRNVAQSDDRGDDFQEIVELTDHIEDDVDDMIYLFGDLKDVAAQIRGKTPPDMKEWYLDHKLKRKEQKKKEKEDKKSSIKVTKLETMQE